MFRKLCLTCGLLVYVALVIFGRDLAGYFAKQTNDVAPQALEVVLGQSGPVASSLEAKSAVPKFSAEE